MLWALSAFCIKLVLEGPMAPLPIPHSAARGQRRGAGTPRPGAVGVEEAQWRVGTLSSLPPCDQGPESLCMAIPAQGTTCAISALTPALSGPPLHPGYCTPFTVTAQSQPGPQNPLPLQQLASPSDWLENCRPPEGKSWSNSCPLPPPRRPAHTHGPLPRFAELDPTQMGLWAAGQDSPSQAPPTCHLRRPLPGPLPCKLSVRGGALQVSPGASAPPGNHSLESSDLSTPLPL